MSTGGWERPDVSPCNCDGSSDSSKRFPVFDAHGRRLLRVDLVVSVGVGGGSDDGGGVSRFASVAALTVKMIQNNKTVKSGFGEISCPRDGRKILA